MRPRLHLAGPALAWVAAAAHADVTVTPTLTSDYDLRGYTQTARNPALQVGLDYFGGPLHASAWASNVDFGPGNPRGELDLLADGRFGREDSVVFDVGVIYYAFPDNGSWSYPEAWVAASRGWFSAAYHYSWKWAGSEYAASYVEGNVTAPIAGSGFSANVHVGRSFGPYWQWLGAVAGRSGEYTDLAVGVSRNIGHFSLTLRYVDSNGVDITWYASPPGSVLSNAGRVIVSLATTLPWASN